MRGEFIAVWPEMRWDVWEELDSVDDVPADLYCELYRDLVDSLKRKPTVEELADIVDNQTQSREAFERLAADDFVSERALVKFLENAHETLLDLGGDPLANRYFNRLASFVSKFSLRYDLRRPCLLCPTLPGMFTSLVRDLKAAASQDAHWDSLMKDYEDSIRDLRTGCTESRMRTCMVKQMNLLEAMGSRFPGVNAKTVGQICNQVGTWPHESVKEAMKNLYTFTCDYPGIRHGGTPANALRGIEMRDMVAMSILLAGFMPYLTDQLNADIVYQGA